MIIISLPNKVKKIKRIFSGSARWCYIGKDTTERQWIATELGGNNRFYLKDRLYKIAERTRQPYLDFVAQIGKEQTDQLNWWASKFASKSPFHTDFFLLVCYKILITELIQEMEVVNDKKLVIFVEDPWLFCEIKNLSHKDVKFIGNPNIFLKKVFCLIRGLIYRLLMIGWFMLAKLLIRLYHNGRKPKALGTENNVVAIINPADKCVFKDGEYISNYLPGVASLYEQNGIPNFYIYPFPFPLSTARYVGRNQEILWPLITDVQFSSVVKRIFEYWKPIFSSKTLNAIDGHHFTQLLEREKWITFSRVGFNFNLIEFDALNSFFRKRWCSHLIYLFENQPWEKMLCMSAVKNNVKAIGYQHSSISKLYISQFIGKNEEAFVPLPYKIVTVGEHFAKLYKEGGIPEDRIVIGGAWRYSHLSNNLKSTMRSNIEIPKRQTILVLLPLDNTILKSMIENLSNILCQNQLNGKVELWLKPHPVTETADLSEVNKLSFRYQITHKPLVDLLNNVNIVIESTSTSGLESFLFGKKVIAYMPENIIAPDPLVDINDERIYKWYEGENFKMDFLTGFLSTDLKKLEEIKKRYFSCVDYKVWLNLVMSKN